MPIPSSENTHVEVSEQSRLGTDANPADSIKANPADSIKAAVLVVDDEHEVARVMARGLTHAGHEVQVAHSGEEALALLQERSFDLLLSDIHMPGIHGDELQRLAREKDPDLAVILITAAQDVTTAVECLREGVFDYVVKPAPLADVAVRVAKALERRRLIRENRDYHANLERRVAEQAERIRSLLIKSLETLSHALEAKDENTRNHSGRVADLVKALAGRLCPEDAAFRLRLSLAALLHDIGKIGVPEAILNKPGALDPEEFAQVQKHPVTGEAILRPLLAGEEDILVVVRHHHERWDGRGYPDGLAGEQTPIGARITAVADAYDAMTSPRAYREGMGMEQALTILRDGAGVQWDPEIVAALLALAEEGLLPDRAPHAPRTGDSLEAPSADAASLLSPSQKAPLSVPMPVIFVRNYLDTKAAERLRVKVDALLRRGRSHLILDLNDVSALEPAAAQMLLQMHRDAQERCARLVLRDVTATALAVFREEGIAGFLDLEPQHSSALHSALPPAAKAA